MMTAIEAAVADLAREERRDLWPRYTANRAGVTTAEAREAMLGLVEEGMLDLYFVVLCENGDEVKRVKHPDKPPVGEEVTCGRCENWEPFTVEAEDIYLVFRPTERLERFA